MKSFFLKVREIQDFLLAVVAKGGINIDQVNGIQIRDDGISLGQAKSVLRNVREYKKESSRFMSDSHKIILAKNLFLNIIRAKDLSYLFFLSSLDDQGVTYIQVSQKYKEWLEKIKKPIKLWANKTSYFKRALIFLLITVILTSSGYITMRLASDNHQVYWLACFFLGILFLAQCLWDATKYLKAIRYNPDNIFFLSGSDELFRTGHDLMEAAPVISVEKIKFNFTSVDTEKLSKRLALALKFGGKLGYIILQIRERRGFNLSGGCLNCYYHEQIVPVIILEHSVILEIEDLEPLGSVYQQINSDFFDKLMQFMLKEDLKLFI